MGRCDICGTYSKYCYQRAVCTACMDSDATIESLNTQISELKKVQNQAKDQADRRSLFSMKTKGMLDMPFYDVTLETSDGVKVPAHRCVLATWSPVFATMFTSGFQEETSRHVQMKDVDSATLNELLTFMYTGELHIQTVTQKEVSLLAAADKYQVLELKEYLDTCLRDLLKGGAFDSEILLTDNEGERAKAVDLLQKALKGA